MKVIGSKKKARKFFAIYGWINTNLDIYLPLLQKLRLKVNKAHVCPVCGWYQLMGTFSMRGYIISYEELRKEREEQASKQKNNK